MSFDIAKIYINVHIPQLQYLLLLKLFMCNVFDILFYVRICVCNIPTLIISVHLALSYIQIIVLPSLTKH